MTVNAAVVAPMPTARIETTAIVKATFRRIPRSA